MNTVVTSKDAILSAARSIVSENGLSALHMRSVAQRCNIALGSLYNYFPSKNDLTMATIESVWQDIFHKEMTCEANTSFLAYVSQIFESVQQGMQTYPNFFSAHSISFASSEKKQAHQMMDRYFQHMKEGLLSILEHENIRKDVFGDTFTKQDFVEFIITSLLTLLIQHSSCHTLLEIIKRTIYES
ncbi:MAG: TetR/AcrR family transcriptional regulator [Longicatena sp.]